MYTVHTGPRTFNVLRPRWLLLILMMILTWTGISFMDPPTVRADSNFNNGFQQAKQNDWQTGQWGSAKFYVDNSDNMYVGAGQLQNNFYDTVGNSAANSIRTLNFEGNVQAPQDSSFLFSNANGNQTNNTLTAIHGLNKVDMSSVTDAYSIFSQDKALTDIDVVDWNVGNVQDFSYAFDNVSNLEKLDLSRWNTNHATSMSYMFAGATDLQNLDVTSVNTMNANVNDMFDNDTHLFWLTLGSSFQIKYESNLTGSPWGSYLGSGNNGLTPMAENTDEDLYEPSSGIWPGSWMGTYNLYGDNGLTKPGNDVVDSTYMGNRIDAAPTYTDHYGNMYIGAGQLQDSISQVTNNHLYVAGENSDQAQQGISNNNINTVSLTAPTATSGLDFYNGSEFNANLVGLFNNSANLTHVYGANNFDASSAVTLANYFANDPSLQDLDVADWNVTKQYDLSNMFNGDTSLDSLNLSNWDTADNLSASQSGMFANDTNLSDLSLGNDTKLKSESDLPNGTWTNAATGNKLSSAQLTDGNSHPGEWYEPSFHRDFQIAQRRGESTGYWGTAPWYIDDNKTMHVGAGQLQGTLYNTTGMDMAKSLKDLSFDESTQAPQDSSNLLSTSYISGDRSSLSNIDNLDHVDMSQVINAKAMFANDTALGGLDLSHLDTHAARDMSFMFNDDWSLTGLNADSFDTSNVNDFTSMFYNNYQLQNPNIGSWNVQNVTDMDDMFWGDGSLYNLGIVNWNPTNLETMDSMFMNNKRLNMRDLSHWNPTHLQNMHSAFVNNESIKYMDLSGWQLPHIQNMESAFNGDSNMDHLDLGQADTSSADDMHFLTDGTHDMNMLTLGPRTQLKDIGYLPGIEWQHDDQVLSDSQLTDGASHPGSWQQTQFSHDFQNAQNQGWTTGHWGTAPYYIDGTGQMKVGSGDLNGPLPSVVGYDRAKTLRNLDFTEKVHAPQDSSSLLSTSFTSEDRSSLSNIDNLDHVDMSSVVNAKAMFANDTALGGLDLSHLDTHNVQDMGFMFYDDGALTGLNANGLNTSNVNDMQSMFFNDKVLNNVQINDWDTSHVQGMAYMFSSDNDLQDLNISNWNTNQVQSMNGMFLNDFQLRDFDISHWNTNNLTDISGMFINDRNISYLSLSGWQIPKLQNMESAFNGALGIRHLDIGNMDTAHTNDMRYSLANDNNIDTLDLGPTTYLNRIDYLPGIEWQHGNDLANDSELKDGNSHWGTWQQTQFSHDFQTAQQKHWDTAYWGNAPFYIDDQHNMYVGTGKLSGSLYDAVGTDMAHDYVHTVNFVGHAQAPQNSSFLLSTSSYGSPAGQDNKTSQLTHINGLDHLDTSQTTNMNSMFANDTALQNVDLSSFDTYHVTDMSYMFSQAWSLQDLRADGLDTSQVTNMHSIFASARSLRDIGIDNWNVGNVQDLSFAFYDDKALSSLDLNDWDIKNVTTLASIFSEDDNLQDLHIDRWDTRKVQDLSCAFLHDRSLRLLNLHDWQTPSLTDFRSAFTGNTSLENLDLSNFDTTQVSDARYAFDEDEDLTNLTFGPATRLDRLTYLPGVEWQHEGHILHNEDLRDGNVHPGFWQQTQFSKDFHHAQANGWQNGRWGNVPYYIDDGMNMHVGSGHLWSNLDNNIGDWAAQNLRTLNMEEPVVAPQNSSFLFSLSNLGKTNDNVLTNINGLDRVDMSQADDIDDIFASDYHLDHLDLNGWNVSNVDRMQFAFYNTWSLTDLHVNDWDTSQVNNMYSIFSGAGKLADLDAKDWNTENVHKMQAAFYNMNSLAHLDLSGWHTDHNIDMTNMFSGNDGLSALTLGDRTTLASNANLKAGLWQMGTDDNKDENDLMDDMSHPGTWQYIPSQDTDKLVGTNYDTLYGLISRRYGLPDHNGNVQVMRDAGSQDPHRDSSLRPGDFSDIYYAVNQDGTTNVYHADLHVIPYTPGNGLQGNTDQSLSKILRDRYGSSATLDDDGGSQNGSDAMNLGDYQVRYHYQDATGNLQYNISNIQVLDNTQTTASYLIVNDRPNEAIYDKDGLRAQLAHSFGIDENDSTLDLSNVSNGTADYRLVSGQHSYTGNIKIIPSVQSNMEMNDLPGQSDKDTWDAFAMKAFDNTAGISFDHSTMTGYQVQDSDGTAQITGYLVPSAGQFANAPVVPYTLNTHPTTQDDTVDNPVNDKQVQDVINNTGSHPHLISVTDGRGTDVTGSFGELSTIPYNSNVQVKVRTDDGYRMITFTRINSLTEPNVDVTHDSATSGADISNDDLQGQIRAQTHESALQGFSIDQSQDVSSNVKEIDYHFTKDVSAQGKGVNVNTPNATVYGTAYVHYLRNDTSTQTYTVTQGTNPVQHISNLVGRPLRVTQEPTDLDTTAAKVGAYALDYQYADDTSDTTYHANVNVTPNYYFSPVTLDNSNGPSGFRGYNYQLGGNYYMSATYSNYGSDDNQSNGNHSYDKDYVDGLHTQDGQVAHFDGRYGDNHR